MKRENERGPETNTASPIVAGARMKALGGRESLIKGGKERRKGVEEKRRAGK